MFLFIHVVCLFFVVFYFNRYIYIYLIIATNILVMAIEKAYLS